MGAKKDTLKEDAVEEEKNTNTQSSETVLVHVGCEDDAQHEFHEERERDGCSHGRRRSCGRVFFMPSFLKASF